VHELDVPEARRGEADTGDAVRVRLEALLRQADVASVLAAAGEDRVAGERACLDEAPDPERVARPQRVRVVERDDLRVVAELSGIGVGGAVA
jgi:hypothetical protein